MSSANPSPPTARERVLVSADRTTVFPQEKATALLQAVCFIKPEGITAYWTPADADLAGVENGLEKYLADQGRKARNNWPAYRRQVTGVSFGAERALFLSYYIPDPIVRPEKPAEPYWMNDGGDTYFRVLYDVKGKEFTWYERNNDP